MHLTIRWPTVVIAIVFLSTSLANDDNSAAKNPFSNGGCLKHQLPPTAADANNNYQRVCNSQDIFPAAIEQRHCRMADPDLNYMEIRINSQNWETPFLQSWIIQILLSELLGIPTSIETGNTETSGSASMNFYASHLQPLDYSGVAYGWELLEAANEIPNGDCRLASKPCAHIVPESWDTQRFMQQQLIQNGIMEQQIVGALGGGGWFIPQFTAQRDPTLVHYFGLAGKANQQKLASTFLRPATWLEYCEELQEKVTNSSSSSFSSIIPSSSESCQDLISSRWPQDESEALRYFVPGLYTGHFRATTENDCSLNNATFQCTGHVVDYPCGWSSHLPPLVHHLNLSLSSSGHEPVSRGYTYSQMVDIWHAANATKSNVIMPWWTPEALYDSYRGTDSQFVKVDMPIPTQECIDARIDTALRCDPDATHAEKVGDPAAACDYNQEILGRGVSMKLTMIDSNDKSGVPNDAKHSPAYATIKALRLTEHQMSEMFALWRDNDGDLRNATCQWVVNNFEKLEIIIPPTFPRVVQDESNNNSSGNGSPLFYVSISVAILSTMVVTLTMTLTHQNRKKRSILLAQPDFLWLLLAGLLLLSVGAILLTVPVTDASCATLVWIANVGFTLGTVPLIVKLAAINRLLLAAKKMRRVKLKKETLFRIVIGVILLVVIHLILWTILDAPKQVAQYQLTDTTTEDGETIVTKSYYCHSNSDVWELITVLWDGLLLLWAMVLAFQTRNIPGDINESRVLGNLICSRFLFFVLRAVLFFFGDGSGGQDGGGNQQSLRLYESLVYSVDAIAACALYFLPKIYLKDDSMGQLSYTTRPSCDNSSFFVRDPSARLPRTSSLAVPVGTIQNMSPAMQDSSKESIPVEEIQEEMCPICGYTKKDTVDLEIVQRRRGTNSNN